MKKLVVSLVIVCCVALFSACEVSVTRVFVPLQVDGDVENSDSETIQNPENAPKYSKIDVDLSKMSGTVAYSQVYDMLNFPQKYEGKVVKIQGPFSVFYSGDTNQYYPAIVVKDATACCANGIEFLLYGKPSYPSGYPKTNDEITIIGVYRVYYEGSQQFYHIVDSIIV